MASRTERSPFGDWWWTVDRLVLAALVVLMLAGIILSLAASPPVAARLDLDAFHFVNRHILFLLPAVVILLVTSLLTPRQIRRGALVVFVVSLVLVAVTPVFGAEIKGARRWIVLLGVNMQPSEFVKPAFVILIAWLFAESARRPEMPANTMALALLLLVVSLLVLQPDFGQTMLIALVWGALFFMAGMRLIWVGGLAGDRRRRPGRRLFHGAARGAAHQALPRPDLGRHASRSTSRWNPSRAAAGSARDRARARSSASCRRATPISSSRWRPRSSASCCAWLLLALFAFIVIRALRRAMRSDDPFVRFAAAGLAILFGLQSAINMAVNLHLMPAKGMTLPFISYGGSSMLSLAYGMGMLLALTRERPRAEQLARLDVGYARNPA